MALRYCIKKLQEKNANRDELKEKIKILHAAGEILINTSRFSWSKPVELPEFLKYRSEELNMMSICREYIREHLLQMSKVNLF